MNELENQASNSPAASPDVALHWSALGDSARAVIAESRAVISDAGALLDLRGRVDRHPYGALLAAAGVGYVLGGGLFSPLTWRVVRLAVLPVVKDQLLPLAAAVLANPRDPG